MEFRVLCLSIIQFLLVSADLLGNHVLGKIACSIKAFQYLTLKAFQGVLSGFYLFLRCCTFCLLQVRLLSNPILSHLGIGCVSDLLEYFLYNFQDDGIHSLGKVQCLSRAGHKRHKADDDNNAKRRTCARCKNRYKAVQFGKKVSNCRVHRHSRSACTTHSLLHG